MDRPDPMGRGRWRMSDTEVTLEKYADLCAKMADTGGDETLELEIAAAEGVSDDAWRTAKEYYTRKMQDPTDMGKTALAFMPLYQAAQARLRGGAPPGSLESYTKVHAEMSYLRDPSYPEKKLDHMKVIADNGFTHAGWLEMEGYWTPRVASDTDPKFDPEQALKFRELLQAEVDRILGIQR